MGTKAIALVVSIFPSVVFLSLQCVPGAEGRPAAHFERIEQLLASRCVGCHGPELQEGGLRLDSREAAIKGGQHGTAIVPGKPAESLLVRAVKHEAAKLAMPPKEQLSQAEIELLVKWIEAGAAWPVAKSVKALPAAPAGERIGDAWSDPRNPIAQLWHGERLDLWSLKPIQAARPPESLSLRKRLAAQRPTEAVAERCSYNLIDDFRCLGPGNAPSPEADRRALLRRLSYDLTGLPPTFEEVEQFQADARPDAYERQVDRLLAAPAFGQHQARAWLDLVRYSDSNGFDWDEFRPRAWRYRDYVIRSLNADKPFDQFTREQLAGDELLAGPPETAAEQDLLIATGYLRIGPQDNSSALFNEQDRSRAEWMNDLVETTAGAFLGLTFNCCRCHDHKHDPISQADYYRLRAFFEPLKYADDLPLDLAPEQDAIRQHNARVEGEIAGIEKQRAELVAAARTRLGKDADNGEVKKSFTDQEKQRDEQLAAAIEEHKKKRRSFTLGLLATDAEGDVPATHILYQGDYKVERAVVKPGFLSALDPNEATISTRANPRTHGRRLALAEWIVSPQNPLTARVLANRIWQEHFGRGLVETPSDFGLAGTRPTNPQLLDTLASELQIRGWSQKALHRQIVTSAVYRGDYREATTTWCPSSRSPWHSPRRLTAEQLRDSLLAVSGLLTGQCGGPPVWPELPADVLTANPALLDDNAEKTKGWYPTPGPARHARSIFQVQKRTVRVPFLETFDLPENVVSCSRRNSSTVAPQALALLNSSLAVEAAAALAERTRSEVVPQETQRSEALVHRLFQIVLQREPDAEERSACTQLLDREGLVQLCRVMLNLNEFLYID